MTPARKLIIVAAGCCWGGTLGFAVCQGLGLMLFDTWGHLFSFFLVLGATLSLGVLIDRHVLEPCRVYRLGWEARGRLEDSHTDSVDSPASIQHRA